MTRNNHHNHPASSLHLPEPGAAPPLASPQLWLYVQTQWRRLFGLNISRIDDLLFVGGEFRANQWPRLYKLGIRVVLSLQAEREDTFEGPPPARTLRLHVQDLHPPAIEQLHEAVQFIGAAHREQLPVLIHCHAGVGRAALTASAYLMSGGLTSAESFARIKCARPIVRLNAIQHSRLIAWEQLLRQDSPPPLTAPEAKRIMRPV